MQVQLAGQVHEAQRGLVQVTEQEERSPQVMLQDAPQPLDPPPLVGGWVNGFAIGSLPPMAMETRARGPCAEAISVTESIRVTS